MTPSATRSPPRLRARYAAFFAARHRELRQINARLDVPGTTHVGKARKRSMPAERTVYVIEDDDAVRDSICTLLEIHYYDLA